MNILKNFILIFLLSFFFYPEQLALVCKEVFVSPTIFLFGLDHSKEFSQDSVDQLNRFIEELNIVSPDTDGYIFIMEDFFTAIGKTLQQDTGGFLRGLAQRINICNEAFKIYNIEKKFVRSGTAIDFFSEYFTPDSENCLRFQRELALQDIYLEFKYVRSKLQNSSKLFSDKVDILRIINDFLREFDIAYNDLKNLAEEYFLSLDSKLLKFAERLYFLEDRDYEKTIRRRFCYQFLKTRKPLFDALLLSKIILAPAEKTIFLFSGYQHVLAIKKALFQIGTTYLKAISRPILQERGGLVLLPITEGLFFNF